MATMKSITINGITYNIEDPDALSGTDTTLTQPGKAADAAAVGASLAAKAPAGYGLGGMTRQISNGEHLAGYNSTGFYSWGEDCPDAPFDGGSMIVVKRGDAYVHQLAFRDSAYVTEIAVRKNTEGNWGEWEWVNPPMLDDIEYRTTQRYMGKPVYVKLVRFGYLPNAGTKRVTIEEDGYYRAPIRLELLLGGSEEYQGTSYGNNWPYIKECYTEANSIVVATTADVSTTYCRAAVWYTRS